MENAAGGDVKVIEVYREENSDQPVGKAVPKECKRNDGTVNLMSVDVDELGEGSSIQVEVEDNVGTVIKSVEVPDHKTIPDQGEGDKEGEKVKCELGIMKGPAVEETGGNEILPRPTEKFCPDTVQGIIERAIKEHLEGKEYKVEECEKLVNMIRDDIHNQVKSQNYKRYKIVTRITLGEIRGELLGDNATKCLWDAEADGMANYVFINETMFCCGLVYGLCYY